MQLSFAEKKLESREKDLSLWHCQQKKSRTLTRIPAGIIRPPSTETTLIRILEVPFFYLNRFGRIVTFCIKWNIIAYAFGLCFYQEVFVFHIVQPYHQTADDTVDTLCLFHKSRPVEDKEAVTEPQVQGSLPSWAFDARFRDNSRLPLDISLTKLYHIRTKYLNRAVFRKHLILLPPTRLM